MTNTSLQLPDQERYLLRLGGLKKNKKLLLKRWRSRCLHLIAQCLSNTITVRTRTNAIIQRIEIHKTQWSKPARLSCKLWLWFWRLHHEHRRPKLKFFKIALNTRWLSTMYALTGVQSVGGYRYIFVFVNDCFTITLWESGHLSLHSFSASPLQHTNRKPMTYNNPLK